MLIVALFSKARTAICSCSRCEFFTGPRGSNTRLSNMTVYNKQSRLQLTTKQQENNNKQRSWFWLFQRVCKRAAPVLVKGCHDKNHSNNNNDNNNNNNESSGQTASWQLPFQLWNLPFEWISAIQTSTTVSIPLLHTGNTLT